MPKNDTKSNPTVSRSLKILLVGALVWGSILVVDRWCRLVFSHLNLDTTKLLGATIYLSLWLVILLSLIVCWRVDISSMLAFGGEA